MSVKVPLYGHFDRKDVSLFEILESLSRMLCIGGRGTEVRTIR